MLFNERPVTFQELQGWVLKQRRELLNGVSNLISEGVSKEEIRSNINVEMASRIFLSLNYIVMGGMVILDEVEATDGHLESILDIYWNGIGKGN